MREDDGNLGIPRSAGASVSRRSKRNKYQNVTPLSKHGREGTKLVAPFDGIPNTTPSSWLDEALPESLWSVLLVDGLERDYSLEVFRRVAHAIDDKRFAIPDGVITHSSLAREPESALLPLARLLVEDEAVAEVLFPLTVLRDLPGYGVWAECLLGAGDLAEAWPRLGSAVLTSLDHQSQEATDCRWMKVLALLVSDKLRLPDQEHVLEILEYPNRGDMRKVRPSIRASEMAVRQAQTATDWAALFWRQCFDETPCGPLFSYNGGPVPDAVGITMDQLRTLKTQLTDAYMSTLADTVVDARRDAVFGMTAYSARLLEELIRPGMSTSVSARMTLRTLAEIAITLAYLAMKDEDEKWMQYRNYGTGQAKMAFLKQEDVDEPSFVTVDALESMANEDRWLEFASIELGNWDKKNLRAIAESSRTKGIYDLYYDWTSHHLHGHWGAVRESCFLVCGNPLHRFHRVLAADPLPLGDVLPDAARVVDRTLDAVRRCYPDAAIDRLVPEAAPAKSDPSAEAQPAEPEVSSE